MWLSNCDVVYALTSNIVFTMLISVLLRNLESKSVFRFLSLKFNEIPSITSLGDIHLRNQTFISFKAQVTNGESLLLNLYSGLFDLATLRYYLWLRGHLELRIYRMNKG